MSARQPFVPQRPSSRQDPTTDTGGSNTNVEEPLKPNGLLSEPPKTSENQAARPPSRAANGLGEISSFVNKPLNLAGFAKKAHNATTHALNLPFGGSRKSLDDSGSRKGSPHPQQSLRLSAPFFSGGPGFAPVSSFREGPATSPLHDSSPGDDFSSNKAHIPTKPPGLHDNNISDVSSGYHRMGRSSHSSLEKIHESAEEDGADPYASYRGRGNVDSYRSSSSPIQEDSRDAAYNHLEPVQAQEKPPLRRAQKRISRVEDLDQDVEYGGPTKRYKADNAENEQAPYYDTSPQLHPNVASEERFSPGRGRTSEDRPFAPVPVYPQASIPQPTINEQHALQRLLGQDLDAYVYSHEDTYDLAKKKWAECSMDEWKAGADELAGKFTKLIEYVKDHMHTKLVLYANLHGSLQTHRTELDRREIALKDARVALVKNGGSVVTGGLNAASAMGVAQKTEDD